MCAKACVESGRQGLELGPATDLSTLQDLTGSPAMNKAASTGLVIRIPSLGLTILQQFNYRILSYHLLHTYVLIHPTWRCETLRNVADLIDAVPRSHFALCRFGEKEAGQKGLVENVLICCDDQYCLKQFLAAFQLWSYGCIWMHMGAIASCFEKVVFKQTYLTSHKTAIPKSQRYSR